MDCIFCKIIKRELPSTVVYEDDAVIVFKNIRPLAPLHYLSVPKRHIGSVIEVTEEDRDAVFAVILGAKRAAEKIGLKGYKLVFNVGKEGGQVIDHLHLHLLGGWRNLEAASRIGDFP